MIKFLARVSNWRYIIPAFVIFCFFTFYLFPAYQSKLIQYTKAEMSPLDTRFSYSPAEVKHYFSALETGGRDIYKVVVGQIDMIYPVAYASLFALTMAFFIRRLTNPNSRWILLALIPLAGMVFDYGENLNTLSLLDSYPNIDDDQVKFGEQMSRMKHILLVFSVLSLVVSAVMLMVRKAFKKSSA